MTQILDRNALASYSTSASNRQPFGGSGVSIAESGYGNLLWQTNISRSIAGDVVRHSAMLDAAGFADQAPVPTKFVKFVIEPAPSSSSSRQSPASAAADYYDGLEGRLAELEQAAQEADAPVERGAVSSAVTLVRQLRSLNYAPPELTWHGGDTVVMLWAFGSTTCAITVTDGEVGYVIRRDRKRLRMRDSIKLKDFKILSIG